MQARDGTRLVVGKERLQADFHKLQRALEEYRLALATADGPDWPADTLNLLRRQQLGLLHARVSVGVGELGLALLQHVLRRLPLEQFRFRARPGATPLDSARADGPAAAPDLRELVAALAAIGETAPMELQDKLHRTLGGILDFFTALAEHQAEGADAAVARINAATANVQSRSLLREIAIITRDVYNTLQSVSEELALDALSDSSGGITEAVQRLNSVVARLDDAATQNLDSLERVNAICRAEAARFGGVIRSLRDAQKRLMQIKVQHPALEAGLTALQARLSDEVGAPVMTLQHDMGIAIDQHLELISNQSFQELTGRTLRRIIAFVETLEADLFNLLNQYRPADRTPQPDSRPFQGPAGQAAPPGEERSQTQHDVDQLLGELGF
jgi:chemotaxis regulatin CheY-phosphate phosphatase CheZ